MNEVVHLQVRYPCSHLSMPKKNKNYTLDTTKNISYMQLASSIRTMQV